LIQSSLYEALKNGQSFDVLLTEDATEANSAYEVCKFLGVEALVLPDFRASYLEDLRTYDVELSELFSALNSYYNAKKKPLIISPIKTLRFTVPKASCFEVKTVEFAQTLDLKLFKEQMLHWGYIFVDIVTRRGEISIRGDILDIFSFHEEKPHRISLFDDEIEEIKLFDATTQKSESSEIEKITITPAFLALDEEKFNSLQTRVENSSADTLSRDISALGFWYLDELAENFLENKKVLRSPQVGAIIDEIEEFDKNTVDLNFFKQEIIEDATEYKELALTELNSILELHKNKKITLIAKSSSVIRRSEIEADVEYTLHESDAIVNLISSTELIVSLNVSVKVKRRRKSNIILDELKPTDYVVHEDYGVGIFQGIESAEIMGAKRDFLAIKYQGDERVLLPVEALDRIDRYVADSGSLPVLDRLGKGSFGKLKAKVKTKLLEIASAIVQMAAQRELIDAPSIKVDVFKQSAFEGRSGFEYTTDQTSAVEAILDELRSGKVMDRLLSGDVGFGKTEVAMQAMYATVRGGYQAAMVVPTTLLSHQHFKSVQERFSEYDISVARIDRFVTAQEKKGVLHSLKEGTVDIVIGTHALFGVAFKKLGLVIIDEEHKFGVKQKEKLKTMFERTHLLSMSATPIPRSLNMALSSIKTLSNLNTAPLERKGVKTFVKEYADALVKEVVMRELRRAGQIFYVFNSIAQMQSKKESLLAFMPNLKILMLHSQISAAVTEKELLAFEEGKYDMLLSTSIIESGIHMPKVNTMLVDGADRFGMADLHQLRGRVGRGAREGYCYFLVEDKSKLTPEATKRLVALESNSFLGSGSVLAYHDLQIRGGGNLLGEAQSGHIKNIGYTLYLRMLEEAINQLTNKGTQEKQKVDIQLGVSAYLSDELIETDRLRLELYRRLNRCSTPSEVYEIEEEVNDRFGKIDSSSRLFFDLMVVKILALNAGILKVSNFGQNVFFDFGDEKKVKHVARSKDDDDVMNCVLSELRKMKSN